MLIQPHKAVRLEPQSTRSIFILHV